MNKIARIAVTIVAFILSVFFLGAVSIAAESDKVALFGIITFAIIVGIPYLVW
jgi:1,4-dihydroxy-2-naphthoate octaprenyltransferase